MEEEGDDDVENDVDYDAYREDEEETEDEADDRDQETMEDEAGGDRRRRNTTMTTTQRTRNAGGKGEAEETKFRCAYCNQQSHMPRWCPMKRFCMDSTTRTTAGHATARIPTSERDIAVQDRDRVRGVQDDTAEVLKSCSAIADATENYGLLRDARELEILALFVEEIVRAEVERVGRVHGIVGDDG